MAKRLNDENTKNTALELIPVRKKVLTYPSLPIDDFFRSLAEDQSEKGLALSILHENNLEEQRTNNTSI
ncbi:MAG: hypothetical protein PF541_00405 [Prolixibacteraceae bacterium]|jgi:hypothetical protein|nr:hypothetical protein [Prolixibacteraceae bacterium]